MVTDVSAIFVANITFLTPGGGFEKIFHWSESCNLSVKKKTSYYRKKNKKKKYYTF